MTFSRRTKACESNGGSQKTSTTSATTQLRIQRRWTSLATIWARITTEACWAWTWEKATRRSRSNPQKRHWFTPSKIKIRIFNFKTRRPKNLKAPSSNLNHLMTWKPIRPHHELRKGQSSQTSYSWVPGRTWCLNSAPNLLWEGFPQQ